mgnify:FL=1
MANCRYVNTSFWDDHYITGLSMQNRYLFLYFLTNSAANLAGAYQINLKRVVVDTDLSLDEIQNGLVEFEASGKIFYRDGWVFLPNCRKHQSDSPKIKTAIKTLIDGAPKWIQDMISIPYGYHIDTILNGSDTVPNIIEYKEQNINETETETDTHIQPKKETTFPETASLTDIGFRDELDETLNWILTKKGVHKKNLPANEWLTWFQDLEAETIDLKSFRSFYEFCEQRDWIINKNAPITPNLMRRELENFKKQHSANGNGKPLMDIKNCTECQGVGFTTYFDETTKKDKAVKCNHTILKQTFSTV